VFRKPKIISTQIVCDILLVYIFVKRYHNDRWQLSCHFTELEASTYNGPRTFARPSQTAMMLAIDGDVIGWWRFRSAGMLQLVGWYIVTDGSGSCS